ncbi:MAG: hypothetical protein Q8M15_04600 [Bacteroidota bacterium]|nr:hypothetical protein [Bacteroidota bacterium]
MKRIILIFVLLAHVFSTVGVFAHTHFCNDYLTDLTFFSNHDEPACCDCTNFNNSLCCEDIMVKSVNKTESTVRPLPNFDLKSKSAGTYFNLYSINKSAAVHQINFSTSIFFNPQAASIEQKKALDVTLLRL